MRVNAREVIERAIANAVAAHNELGRHDHWDSTQMHGLGCERCIKQNQIALSLGKSAADLRGLLSADREEVAKRLHDAWIGSDIHHCSRGCLEDFQHVADAVLPPATITIDQAVAKNAALVEALRPFAWKNPDHKKTCVCPYCKAAALVAAHDKKGTDASQTDK